MGKTRYLVSVKTLKHCVKTLEYNSVLTVIDSLNPSVIKSSIHQRDTETF